MSIYTEFKFASTILLVITLSLGITNSGISAPLSGEYIITPSGSGDFLSLEEAIAEIETEGMSAPVTLKIRVQTYQTHVTIGDFMRTGQADDLLTITAENPQTPPLLQHDAQSESDNWVIQLNQASYINISNLTLEATGTMDLNNIITLENESSHIEITDNKFNSYAISSSTNVRQGASINNVTDTALSEISIINNEFNGGNSGIRFKGTFNTNISPLQINNNVFNDQIGTGSFNVINLTQCDDVTLNFNTINNNIFNSKGMNFFGVNRGEMNGNTIAMLGGGAGGTAFAIGNTNAAVEDTIIIKNNFMTASRLGLEIRSPNSNNINVLHNTIVIDSDLIFTFPSNVMKVDSGTDNINIQNNILINAVDSDNSFVMTLADTASINTSDGNLFFGLTDHQFDINEIIYADLLAYQTATSLDINSVTKDIDFVDAENGDLHLTTNQYTDPDLLTIPITEVGFDIDGDMRSLVTPLMGADELNVDLIFSDSFEQPHGG